MPDCRWRGTTSGIACNRSGPNRGCRRIKMSFCHYPGFERPLLGEGCPPNCEYRDADPLPRRKRPLPPFKAIVMDRPRRRQWHGDSMVTAHLACEDLDKLHHFAAMIGLDRSWFQDGRHPHYDLIGANVVGLAMRAGAVIEPGVTLVRVTMKARGRG